MNKRSLVVLVALAAGCSGGTSAGTSTGSSLSSAAGTTGAASTASGTTTSTATASTTSASSAGSTAGATSSGTSGVATTSAGTSGTIGSTTGAASSSGSTSGVFDAGCLLQTIASAPTGQMYPATFGVGVFAALGYDGGGPLSLLANDYSNGAIDIAPANGTFGPFTSVDANGDGGASFPGAITVADVNGDHWPDLLFSTFYSADVGVVLGLSDGGYAGVTFIPVAQAGVSIVAGDFNDDGIADLVLTSPMTASVQVAFGSATTPLTSSTTIVLPQVGAYFAFAGFAVVGDFNHDGNPDLVLSDITNDNLFFVAGTGTMSFGTPLPFATSTESVYSGIAAHLRDAGYTDLVVVNHEQDGGLGLGSLDVFLSTGAATGVPFLTAAQYPDLSETYGDVGGLVAIDVNGDGILDLVGTFSNGLDQENYLIAWIGGGSNGIGDGTYVETEPVAIVQASFEVDSQDVSLAAEPTDGGVVFLATTNDETGSTIIESAFSCY